ncbi:MAG: hypothetical protein KDA95_06620 [Acidimicrobiales bacterium]|nr:hypothetical protein [Acidimicrobiales bacterium]
MFRRQASTSDQQLPSPPADPVRSLDRSKVPQRFIKMLDDVTLSEQRWRLVLAQVKPGPLEQRLRVLSSQIVAGVLEMYAVMVRVGEMDQVIAALDPEDAVADYKAARRRQAEGQEVAEMDSLQARFGSVQRLLNVVADAQDQLTVLEARLLAAAAAGAELAITADDRGLTSTGQDLELVLTELGALRRALTTLG